MSVFFSCSRRHARLPCVWVSDVRSSDLAVQGPPRHRRLVGARRGVDVLPRDLRLLPPLGLAPPSPAPPQRIQRAVPGDRENPWHERATSRIVPVDVAPHLREYVARDLLSFRLIVQNAAGEPEHPRRQHIVQLTQRPLVPRLQAPNQRSLRLLTKTFWLGHLDFR